MVKLKAGRTSVGGARDGAGILRGEGQPMQKCTTEPHAVHRPLSPPAPTHLVLQPQRVCGALH